MCSDGTAERVRRFSGKGSALWRAHRRPGLTARATEERSRMNPAPSHLLIIESLSRVHPAVSWRSPGIDARAAGRPPLACLLRIAPASRPLQGYLPPDLRETCLSWEAE